MLHPHLKSPKTAVGSQGIAKQPPNKHIAIAIAVLFIIVLILNYALPLLLKGVSGDEERPEAQSPHSKGPNVSAWTQGNSSEALPQLGGALPPQWGSAISSKSPPNFTVGSYNCTPLGNPRELLMIDTSYKVISDGMPIYTRSTFEGVYGATAVHSVRTFAYYNGERISTEARYTYGLDGKCQKVEYSQLYPGSGSHITECSSYPIWFVCRELVDKNKFVRNDSVTVGGRMHKVSVYRSGALEVWIGDDIPILYRLYASGIAEDGTNKSISIELIDVGAS
ncbi:MAG: hypothetical protein N3H30_01025 [Candidatus Micrarchaeota archaeon]|nr:hypothetical protein [Candidatus Micrarchaeota archaeon]